MADAIEEQISALRGADAVAREAAAQELGRRGDPRAAGPLSEALGDLCMPVRKAALSALRALGDPAAAELLACLRDPDPRRRLAALRGLWVLGCDAPAILAHILDCPEPEMRRALSEPIGQPDDPAAVEHILEMLAEDEDDLRQAAWATLSGMGELPLAEAVRTALRGDPGPLVRLRDPRALAALTHALASGFLFVRRAAVKALGQIGGADVVEPLLKALDDPETDVRQAAVETLGYLGDRRAVEPLLRVLAGKRDRLRPAAAEALGHLRDPRAVAALVAALQDPAVTRSAAVALGMMGAAAGTAVEPLRALARSGDDSLRWVCERSLKQIENALRNAPAELLAASAPEGGGTEPEAASAPEGTGTEPIHADPDQAR